MLTYTLLQTEHIYHGAGLYLGIELFTFGEGHCHSAYSFDKSSYKLLKKSKITAAAILLKNAHFVLITSRKVVIKSTD